MFEPLLLILSLQLGVSLAWFFLGGLFANAYKNAGIIDLFWAGSLILQPLLLVFILSDLSFRILLLLALVLLASLRLTFYLVKRFLQELPVEDARYKAFRTLWQEENRAKGLPENKNISLYFMGLFALQAILPPILLSPLTLSALNSRADLVLIECIACGLLLLAVLGEALADDQLARFKQNPANQGLTCREGLWRFSRHPNYFFQWLLWVALWLFACASPYGVWTLLSPLLMLYFLLFVTGVKFSEERALKSRRDYAEYQASTSVFIPWFPKN